MFLLISQKMLNKLNFINYSEDRKNDFQSLSTLYMVRYLKNYDPERTQNPFSYFSQICFNAYLQVIIANKKRDKTFVSLDFITSKENVNVAENYNSEI